MHIYSSEIYFRADEWNVNKWAWEGTLKVISKGEECIIRLEDKSTGKLSFVLCTVICILCLSLLLDDWFLLELTTSS